MNLYMKAVSTAVAIVLLVTLGINAWNYFAYGGFTGSFFSVAVIAMAYGFAATAIVVLLTKIWTKS
jgi:hypothetical protein